MKGKILGFTASSGVGAITGDDGARYTFAAAEWRSEKPIAVGASVDFAPDGGAAAEVYPLSGNAIGTPDLAALNASPAVQRVKRLSLTTLAFPLAVLLLIATFLPAISGTTLDPRFPSTSASLWGLGGLSKVISANPLLANDDVETAQTRITQLEERTTDLRTHSTGFGGMPVDNSDELASIAKQRAQAESQLGRAKFASTISSLLVVRWSVPILALVLIWLSWSGKPAKAIAIAAGAAALVTAAVIYEYRQTIVGAGGADENAFGGMISKQMDAAISVGLGTYLIGLLGIGLILAGLGVIKNPLASKIDA